MKKQAAHCQVVSVPDSSHGGRVWKTAHIRVVLTPRICKPQRFNKRHVNSKALSKLHASSILNALESTCRIWSRCGSYLLITHPFWGACRTTLVWAVFQTLPPCTKSLVPRLIVKRSDKLSPLLTLILVQRPRFKYLFTKIDLFQRSHLPHSICVSPV